MIDYTYFDLFQQDSVDKQLIMQFDNVTITNEDLFAQSLTLEESLCSQGELHFGACEASVLKFKVANIVAPMKDKWLSVKMVLNNHANEPFVIGRYKVAEDKLTADRMWREITAYDAMCDIINADGSEMAAWYNEVFPNTDSTVTLREFRTRFISYFGLQQVLPQEGLVNDNMIVEKTIEPEQISGKDIITAICEINGCFGHIGRDGKFHYIYLPQAIQGLYPSNTLYPANDLFPRDPKGANVGSKGSYIDIVWEDFVTESINKIQIRQEENDIGKIYPDTPTSDSDNSYIIQDNFLVYGKSSEELLPIARNLLGKITAITYRPVTNSDFKGNPCLEVGDPIRVGTKYELVETYILERTLKGIQALRDSYLAKGVKKRTEQVNGMHSSIMQLKSKTNILTRTIEETRSEIKDMENGLETKILQNAKEIELEAKRAISSEVELAAAIKITADNITAEVKRATDAEGELSGKISVNADNITAEVKRATDAEGELSGKISVNADNITAEVKRATGQEVELAAAIKITEDNIKLKVSKGDVSSEISQESGKISIEANRISIKSDKFTLTEDGKVECSDIKITGGSIYTEGADGSFTKIEAGKITSGKKGSNWNTTIKSQAYGSGVATVVDSKVLWLKAESLMFGYSNSPYVGYTGNLKTALDTLAAKLYVHNGIITLL